MISVENIALRVATALDSCNIPFILAGAFSSNHYGIPRSTKDADFVLQLKSAVGEKFARALGEPFELEPQLSFETNTGTYRQILKYPGSPFIAELLSNDLHDQERFKRRRDVQFLGRTFWFPSPEDVIITKLRWARSRDKDDVRNVMSVQQGKLDWPYIEKWCKEHGTIALLQQIRRSVPDI